MDFLKRLFGSEKEKFSCPRCLGKGHVDMEDIKRLKKELYWSPGNCAYCNGVGLVDAEVLSKVPADESWLTDDTPKAERERLLIRDSLSMERGKQWEIEIEKFVEQILYLYNTGKLSPEQITEFYLLPEKELFKKAQVLDQKEAEFLDYVNKVIATRGGKDD